ncbi:conserved hypothetical protein [Tenacibaculum dicentrarchi]|uniref:Restriction endonuclease subunit S n=1 Tax=Tenacibaculum dicentrarchi TaxID=669041 RepID=A0ABM9NZX1_9FLAO|nr:conserved hypothetical protein [Tenacibaculum dicentrarchi]
MKWDIKMELEKKLPYGWKIVSIGEIFEFKNGLNKEKKFFGEGTPIINYKDVYKETALNLSNVKGKVTVDNNELERYSVKKGDVFFTRTSESVEEIAFSAVVIEEIPNAVFSGFVLRARDFSEKLDNNFKRYCFSGFDARKEIIRKSTYTTRALTNGTVLSEVKLLIPPLKEQQEIAKILSTWDEAIETTQSLIEKLQFRKKGLMQELLSGKKRLAGFSEEWEEMRLGEVTNRITKKNTELNDTVITISAQRGFVRQEDYFKKRVASKTLSGYYLIEKGHFAYNKSYSKGYPMGAFKRLDTLEKAVVTTLYICFEANENIDSDFLLNYFEGGMITKNLTKIAQEGGRAHGLLNIGINEFFALKLTVPSLSEQKAISKIIDLSDIEISEKKAYLLQLKNQKKGLMQQLLTGKKRVKF